jgi:hypothetical protein
MAPDDACSGAARSCEADRGLRGAWSGSDPSSPRAWVRERTVGGQLGPGALGARAQSSISWPRPLRVHRCGPARPQIDSVRSPHPWRAEALLGRDRLGPGGGRLGGGSPVRWARNQATASSATRSRAPAPGTGGWRRARPPAGHDLRPGPAGQHLLGGPIERRHGPAAADHQQRGRPDPTQDGPSQVGSPATKDHRRHRGRPVGG